MDTTYVPTQVAYLDLSSIDYNFWYVKENDAE